MAKVQRVPRFGRGKTATAQSAATAASASRSQIDFSIDPAWHRHWVTREGPGVLETAQFILMVIAFAIAVLLLFDPFVRRRPLVLAVTLIAALSCLYIAGEEVSWGQHIFFWQDPGLLSEVNDEGEFSIHNMNKAFERTPRTLLELGVLIGGLSFRRYVRSSPASGIAALRCFCRVPFWSRLRCSAGLQAGRHGVEVHRNECPGGKTERGGGGLPLLFHPRLFDRV